MNTSMYDALNNLYIRKIVNKAGLRKAVSDKVITADDYQKITGETY